MSKRRGSKPADEEPAAGQLAFLDDTLDELAGARKKQPQSEDGNVVTVFPLK